MTTLRALTSRAQGNERWLAIDPTGAVVIDLPTPRPDWLTIAPLTGLIGAGPLDAIERSGHGATVAAFERARRIGHGSARVRMVGMDTAMQIDIFDCTDEFGCFVAVLAPARTTALVSHDRPRHGIRQGSLGLSISGVIEWVDPALGRLLGWESDEMIGRPTLEFIHPDDHEVGIVAWIDMLESPGEGTTLRQRFKAVGGSWVWCDVTDWNLLDDPQWGCVRADLVDISRELEAIAELQRRETLLDRLSRALPTGVLYVDGDDRTLVANDRWDELTGCSAEAGLDAFRAAIADAEAFDRAIETVRADAVDVDLEVRLLRRPGGTAVCEFGDLHLRPLREDGRSLGLLLTLDDRTESRRLHDELARQLRHDRLTGLLNRHGMEEALRERLAAPLPEFSLAFLDLDRFKSINDASGHGAGDEFLRRVATEVRAEARARDRVARIGGDEFVAILDGCAPGDGPDGFRNRVIARIETLRRELHPGLDVGVSVGIAAYEPGDTLDDLLRRADAAMYDHKHGDRAGRAVADV